ncbi:2-dehydropantoate 2-reductase [Serendipita vermifera]|nr:2-dehydropantoate 2-reductase [Serendipita vermifera]
MTDDGRGQRPLRILIVGAGAVGLFYGSRLHQPQSNTLVSLVCRSNYDAIKSNGVRLLTHSFGDYTFQPEGTFKSVDEASHFVHSKKGLWDFVVVTTKALPPSSSSSNSEANLIKAAVSPETTIVLIQNGIGIEEPYSSTFPNNVVLSTVTVVSAEQIENGIVRQNRWTRISIGPWSGGDPRLVEKGNKKTKEFADLLKQGGVKDAEQYDENGLQFVRWHKIAINASFNPSSVLSNGAPNSTMAADPLLKTHILGVMHEILHLATVVLKSPLPSKFASPEKIIESTLRNTAENFNRSSTGGNNSRADKPTTRESSRPSMWYDWAGGKPMELEVILGNVVRAAEQVHVDVPRVQSMYALLCMAQTRRDAEKQKKKQNAKL